MICPADLAAATDIGRWSPRPLSTWSTTHEIPITTRTRRAGIRRPPRRMQRLEQRHQPRIAAGGGNALVPGRSAEAVEAAEEAVEAELPVAAVVGAAAP